MKERLVEDLIAWLEARNVTSNLSRVVAEEAAVSLPPPEPIDASASVIGETASQLAETTAAVDVTSSKL